LEKQKIAFFLILSPYLFFLIISFCLFLIYILFERVCKRISYLSSHLTIIYATAVAFFLVCFSSSSSRFSFIYYQTLFGFIENQLKISKVSLILLFSLSITRSTLFWLLSSVFQSISLKKPILKKFNMCVFEYINSICLDVKIKLVMRKNNSNTVTILILKAVLVKIAK